MLGTVSLPLRLFYEDKIWKCGLCLSNIEKEELQTNRPYFLHTNEQAYFSTLLYLKRQHSYLLGRYSAKKAIAAYTGFDNLTEIWIETGVFHYPVVNHPVLRNIQVSISHCDTLGAALAFPEVFPMGIDVEEICINKIGIIERQISPAEKKKFSLNDTAGEVSMQLWTSKEALSKILKCGLAIPFDLLEIDEMEERENIRISYFKNFKQYQASSFLLNNTMCSIVYPKKTSFTLDLINIRKNLERH